MGWGSQARQQKQAEDDEVSLRGNGTAASVGLIAHGPLEGFPSFIVYNGRVRSDVENHLFIRLNGNPVKFWKQSPPNVRGFFSRYRNGTLTQRTIPGFTDNNPNDIPVNQLVRRRSGVVTVTSNNSQCDMFVINVSVRMLRQEDALKKTDLDFNIFVQTNSEGFKLRQRVSLRELAPQDAPLSFDVPVNNRNGTVTSFSIRLQKVTPDGDNTRTVNELNWLSYGEVINVKSNFSGTAVLAARVGSESYSSFPDIAIDQCGQIGLQIPSGVTIRSDRTLNYGSATWTGATTTTSVAINDIFPTIYNELTSGLRTQFPRLPSEIELADLFDLSKWNNALVTDQDGIQRPRWRLTFYLNQAQSGFENLDALCSSCFANYYEGEDGKIRFTQDRDGLVETQQFGNNNVGGGRFNYPETAQDTRYNACTVEYWDPIARKPAYTTYEDAADIALNGYKPLRVVALGTESRWQAYRYAKGKVVTSLLEYKYCQFEAEATGVFLRPGQVITVFDEDAANVRNAGYIRAVNGARTGFTLDAAVTTAAGDQFRITLPDGTRQNLTVASFNSVSRVLTTTTAATVAPNRESLWAIANAVQPQQFKIKSVTMGDAPNTWKVNSINYISNKWQVVENNAVPLIPRFVGEEPPASFDVGIISVNLLEVDASGLDTNPSLFTLEATWQEPTYKGQAQNPYVLAYIAEFRVSPDGNWSSPQRLPKGTNSARWPGLVLGRYQVRVSVIDIFERMSVGTNSSEVLTTATAIVNTPTLKQVLRIPVQNLTTVSIKIKNTGSVAVSNIAFAFKGHGQSFYGTVPNVALQLGQIQFYSQAAWSSVSAIPQNNPRMAIQYSRNTSIPLNAGAYTHLVLSTQGVQEIALYGSVTSGSTTLKVYSSGNPLYWEQI